MMIKDDALALTRIYIVANRVAKPIEDDRKKNPCGTANKVSLFIGRKVRKECCRKGSVVFALFFSGREIISVPEAAERLVKNIWLGFHQT